MFRNKIFLKSFIKKQKRDIAKGNIAPIKIFIILRTCLLRIKQAKVPI